MTISGIPMDWMEKAKLRESCKGIGEAFARQSCNEAGQTSKYIKPFPARVKGGLLEVYPRAYIRIWKKTQ